MFNSIELVRTKKKKAKRPKATAPLVRKDQINRTKVLKDTSFSVTVTTYIKIFFDFVSWFMKRSISFDLQATQNRSSM